MSAHAVASQSTAGLRFSPPLAAAKTAAFVQRPARGIALILASTTFFAASDVLTKALANSLPAFEITWIRYVVFSSLILPVLLATSGGARSRRPGLQVVRGFGTVLSSLLFAAGVAVLPIAEASAINFVSPILITALSIPLLGEAVGWRRWTAALAGLVGVLIVIRPGASTFATASLLPLAAAASWAGAAVVTRMMSGADRPITTLAYSALVGTAVTSLIVPFVWVLPTKAELGLGVGIGLLSTAGHWLVVLAYRHAAASTIAPFSYVQLIWAGVLGFLVFGSVPDLCTVAGASIIALSGLYTAHRERVRTRAA